MPRRPALVATLALCLASGCVPTPISTLKRAEGETFTVTKPNPRKEKSSFTLPDGSTLLVTNFKEIGALLVHPPGAQLSEAQKARYVRLATGCTPNKVTPKSPPAEQRTSALYKLDCSK